MNKDQLKIEMQKTKDQLAKLEKELNKPDLLPYQVDKLTSQRFLFTSESISPKFANAICEYEEMQFCHGVNLRFYVETTGQITFTTSTKSSTLSDIFSRAIVSRIALLSSMAGNGFTAKHFERFTKQ